MRGKNMFGRYAKESSSISLTVSTQFQFIQDRCNDLNTDFLPKKVILQVADMPLHKLNILVEEVNGAAAPSAGNHNNFPSCNVYVTLPHSVAEGLSHRFPRIW